MPPSSSSRSTSHAASASSDGASIGRPVVGHEPRHGNAYVESWVLALRNDPREIRAAAVDAQRMADWMVARERDRAPERAEPARAAAAAVPAGHRSRDAPALSEELRAVVRDAGAAGYRAGYAAAGQRLPANAFESVRSLLPRAAGRELTFVVEQAHGDAYLRGMEDRQRGREAAPDAAVRRSAAIGLDAAKRLEAELAAALRSAAGAGYGSGYAAAAAGRGSRPRPSEPPGRGLADPAGHPLEDAAARATSAATTTGRAARARRRPWSGGTRSTTSARRPRSGSGPRCQAALRYTLRADAPARTAADARERDAGAEPLTRHGTCRRRPAGGDAMTDGPDVYTTLGLECGCCGHRHATVEAAGRCLEAYRRRTFSDRRVVAVAADAPWPPAAGRDLNDAELAALYADRAA